ncbi:MAG: hypothetical protein RLZZ387_3443 [Chloroflexota bacterium]|jgi:ParB family chromosome partitioning protein
MSKRRASLADRELPQAAAPRATDSVVLGAERARQEVEELPVRAVMPNRLQPRTRPTPEGLEELAASIRLHGVLEPIIVRGIPLTEYDGAGRRYELIAGERRWRASHIAGRTTIPAIVTTSAGDDRAMLELAITENLQREDLHPLDEALAFGRMQSELGYSYAEIAGRIGKSKGYVQNRMRLLQVDEDLQRLVAERPDTLKHVYEIARVADPDARGALIAAVRDDALSFVETRARVQAILTPPESYSREYDRDIVHEQVRAQAESYSREYDRDEHHDPEAAGVPAPAQRQAPAAPVPSGRLLTAREEAAVLSVMAKIERLQAGEGAIAPEDLATLAALAGRVSELLRQIGASSAARRAPSS